MYQFALNPRGYLDVLTLVLPAISSMLAMMSIAFSPWILYATVSSTRDSSIVSSSYICSEESSTFAATACNSSGKEMLCSLSNVDRVTKVDYARKSSDSGEMKTTNIETNDHQLFLHKHRIYNEEETPSSPALITAASNSNEQSPSPTPTSPVENPAIITPKRHGLATNVIFLGATISVETRRSLKRKISHDVASSDESDFGNMVKKNDSFEAKGLEPKKKKLKSPLSTKQKANNANAVGMKAIASNKKALLSDRRFQRIEENRVQRKKKKKSSTKNWMAMYEKLVSFREQHNGSTVIPWDNRDSDLQQLGYWLRDQKRKLKRNKLSRRHADLLRSIGIA